jgi:hypothetical protein
MAVLNKSVFPFFEMQKAVIGSTEAGVAKVTELFTLPTGAEITYVSVAVTTAFVASTTIDLGLTSGADTFMNDQSLAAVGVFATDKAQTLIKPENVTVTFNQASASGEAVVRIGYFLPSTEPRDY